MLCNSPVMHLCSLFVLFCLSGAGFSGQPIDNSHVFKTLVQDLFADYDKFSRPIVNSDDVIEVDFTLTITQIVDVDEKEEQIKVAYWPGPQIWNDSRLTWNFTQNTSDFPLLVHIEKQNLWMPNIILINEINGQFEPTFPSNVLVRHDGVMNWVPPSIGRIPCAMDPTYFPYDNQVCSLTFVSWTYPESQLRLLNHSKDAVSSDYPEQFYESVEWQIIEIPARVHSVKLPGMPGNYSALTYEIYIRRKPLFYEINLLMPVAILSTISLFVFYLPSEESEKMSISISLLLALVPSLIIISQFVPTSFTYIPLLVLYLVFNMVMVTATVITSVVIINHHWRSPATHSMQPWLRQLFCVTLPKLLQLKRPEGSHENHMDEINWMIFANRVPYHQLHIEDENPIPTATEYDPHYEMSKSLASLQYIAQFLITEHELKRVKGDWKYVAIVMDRIFFIVFLLVFLLGSIAIFFRSPHLWGS